MIMNRFQQYENSPTTVALLNERFIKQQLEPLKHIYIVQIFRVNHSCFNSISVQQRFILAKSCKRQNDRTKQKWSFLGGLKKWIEKKSTRTCEEQKPLQWRDNHDLTIETLSWSAASRSDKSRLPSSSAPTESWSKPQPSPQTASTPAELLLTLEGCEYSLGAGAGRELEIFQSLCVKAR